MFSVYVSVAAMLISVAGLALGNILRASIPDEHVLREDSLKSLELSAAMMGTLVALVIGLLVSSSKNAFDLTTQGITQAGASILTLDGMLRAYGPETESVRKTLRLAIQAAITHIQDGDLEKSGARSEIEPVVLQQLHHQIRVLKPQTEAAEDLRKDALELSGKLMQDRWLLIEQSQNELPLLFLVMLLVWLFVLFGIFGLITPRNPTTLVCQIITACSMSGALFLVLELNRPLTGSMKVSLSPLTKAIDLLEESSGPRAMTPPTRPTEAPAP